ncbi:MAG: response regulator [Candidatus Methylomirabilales bacterium]
MAERVLIVEDDAGTREGLSFHLRRLGFDVSAAPDGPAALAAIHDRPPDVLLLDLKLPGEMDGIQVLRSAREVAPRVGAIVMTGHPSAETTVQALRLGAYDYVAKPFDLGAMSRVLAKLVEKLRWERQVAQATSQLETVARCTRIAINAMDLEGRFTHWGSERLLGYAPGEMVGRATPAAYIVTPGFDLRAELEACRAEGSTVREHLMRQRGGAVLSVREERVRLTDEAGRHIGYTAHLTDITEERQARETKERYLREVEQRLATQRRALEAVRSVAALVRQRTGVRELLAQGLTLLLGVVADVRLAWCFLAEGEAEGFPRVADVGGRPVFLGGWAEAEPAGRLGAADFCDASACECVARLQEEGGDLAPRIVACRRLRGLGQAAGPEHPGHLSLPLRIPGELVGVLNVAKAGYKPFPAEEITLLEILADQFGVGIAAARLDARMDALLGELKEHQRRILQTQKLRAVGELASGVAHDFNNLLTAILGRAELLLREESDPRRAEEIRIIQRAAQDGGETVRRILEFAHGRASGDAVRVDLRAVVAETLDLTRSRWRDSAQARGISIQVEQDLQPVPAIAGSPAELREMLTNLILNAIDAMPAGGTLRLATRALPGAGPGRVELTVEDTGVGMTPEVLDRIFDPFFTTKEGSGSGLGLSVSYAIVERHGGELQATSHPGRGSVFAARFPALAAGEVVRTPAGGTGAIPDGQTPGARILVVDDEARLAQLLRTFLELQGHAVWTATDGPQGIALLGRQPFDLILTDLGMPEVSGWDVAREARRLAPRTPVVLVSGWGAQIEAEEVEAAGIARVIQKPYTFDAIRRVLAEVLGGGTRPAPPGPEGVARGA